jgi:nicotinamide riboside transporter PnuC
MLNADLRSQISKLIFVIALQVFLAAAPRHLRGEVLFVTVILTVAVYGIPIWSAWQSRKRQEEVERRAKELAQKGE